MDELIIAYYKAKDSNRTGEVADLWERLDDVSRVIAEPLIEIPKGIQEGRIRVTGSNFAGSEDTAKLAVEVVIEGRRGCREMSFALDVPWKMLDDLDPGTYADVSRTFGFPARPQAS